MTFITIPYNSTISWINFFNWIKRFIQNSKNFKTIYFDNLIKIYQLIKQTARNTPDGCMLNEIGSSLKV